MCPIIVPAPPPPRAAATVSVSLACDGQGIVADHAPRVATTHKAHTTHGRPRISLGECAATAITARKVVDLRSGIVFAVLRLKLSGLSVGLICISMYVFFNQPREGA